MTKRRKLKICLLLHEKFTLQSMRILSACVKRFVRRLEDGENVQTHKLCFIVRFWAQVNI